MTMLMSVVEGVCCIGQLVGWGMEGVDNHEPEIRGSI